MRYGDHRTTSGRYGSGTARASESSRGAAYAFRLGPGAQHRADISGHAACSRDGTLAKPLGKVGTEVSPEQGYASARLVALAHLASLKRAVGNLDRVTAWLRVFAMVNVAPGFNETPLVTNGYSDLILELYGPDVGAHARSSIGMAIPLNAPVNCEAEVEIDG